MKAADVVFNIQRYSLHDGPGIRTTVFLKGCSMRCFWCHNPEGQRPEPELRYVPERCIACAQCVIACPNHAHEMHDGVHVFLREKCDLNGTCVEACCSRALQMEGRVMTADQVMDEILPDKPFYQSSGGGITLSGGQKQRTSIARALIRQPRILILDDCLSAVDTYTEEEILRRLRTFMKGRTSIIISHRISTVKEADLIIVLDKGQIVERGTHEELVAHGGIYSDLNEKQLLERELEQLS